jgi:hypothetical protein
MDLTFDVHDDFTNVTSLLTAESRDRPLPELVLNAKNLEITSVACAGRECSYRYDAQASLLKIDFPDPVPPRTRFTIRTVTTCRPTKNILEGLYYDETPLSAPPQQITQCQQWGFQRLVPCIDDMTAKCTYVTTIIADERYTNIITNGDPVGGREPAGPGRVRVRYENTVTPMAPYLFFIGCGTYATFRRNCEYPDGRSFGLELLVPPGSDPDRAERALDILHDAVVWVHLYTGPGRYDQQEIRNRIYTLNKIVRGGPISKEEDLTRDMIRALLNASDLKLKTLIMFLLTSGLQRGRPLPLLKMKTYGTCAGTTIQVTAGSRFSTIVHSPVTHHPEDLRRGFTNGISTNMRLATRGQSGLRSTRAACSITWSHTPQFLLCQPQDI